MFHRRVRGAVCVAAMFVVGCFGSPEEVSAEPVNVSSDETLTPQASSTGPCRAGEVLFQYDPSSSWLVAKDRNGNGLLCVELRGKRELYSDDRIR